MPRRARARKQAQGKSQEVAAGNTDATFPSPSLCLVPMASSSSHPLCCCAWPGPTSPLTLTSELSYKYNLSILVTFPKKCFQVINTQASATLPALPPGWLGAGGWGLGGGSVRLESREGNRRSRITYLPEGVLGFRGSGRRCEEDDRALHSSSSFLKSKSRAKKERK